MPFSGKFTLQCPNLLDPLTSRNVDCRPEGKATKNASDVDDLKARLNNKGCLVRRSIVKIVFTTGGVLCQKSATFKLSTMAEQDSGKLMSRVMDAEAFLKALLDHEEPLKVWSNRKSLSSSSFLYFDPSWCSPFLTRVMTDVESAAVEEHEQKLLSSHVWTDYVRLRRLEWSIPRADRAVHSIWDGPELKMSNEEQDNNREGDNDQDDQVEDPDDPITGSCPRPVTILPSRQVDLNHDPYCLKKYFRRHWEYVRDPKSMPTWSESDVFWTSYNLYRESESSGLQAYHPNQSTTFQIQNDKRIWLSDCISSALLLLRLTAVFHDPAFMSRDPYKECWKIAFQAKGDKRSRLTLCDSKGAAQVSYSGSEENSKAALQLVDWLIGDNVPHSYDYTLCGRVG